MHAQQQARATTRSKRKTGGRAESTGKIREATRDANTDVTAGNSPGEGGAACGSATVDADATVGERISAEVETPRCPTALVAAEERPEAIKGASGEIDGAVAKGLNGEENDTECTVSSTGFPASMITDPGCDCALCWKPALPSWLSCGLFIVTVPLAEAAPTRADSPSAATLSRSGCQISAAGGCCEKGRRIPKKRKTRTRKPIRKKSSDLPLRLTIPAG